VLPPTPTGRVTRPPQGTAAETSPFPQQGPAQRAPGRCRSSPSRRLSFGSAEPVKVVRPRFAAGAPP
jgi:hypothetical protein